MKCSCFLLLVPVATLFVMSTDGFESILLQRMSEFQLRDALASAEFSGRVSDVFAGLGRDQVRPDSSDDSQVKHPQGRVHIKNY